MYVTQYDLSTTKIGNVFDFLLINNINFIDLILHCKQSCIGNVQQGI